MAYIYIVMRKNNDKRDELSWKYSAIMSEFPHMLADEQLKIPTFAYVCLNYLSQGKRFFSYSNEKKKFSAWSIEALQSKCRTKDNFPKNWKTLFFKKNEKVLEINRRGGKFHRVYNPKDEFNMLEPAISEISFSKCIDFTSTLAGASSTKNFIYKLFNEHNTD